MDSNFDAEKLQIVIILTKHSTEIIKKFVCNSTCIYILNACNID